MRPYFIIAALALAGFSETVLGQHLFKCSDESGTIIFSESSCGNDAEEMYLQESQTGLSPVDSYQSTGRTNSSQSNTGQKPNQAGLTTDSEKRLRVLEFKLDVVRSERRRQSPYVSQEAKRKLASQESSIQAEINSIRGYTPSNRTSASGSGAGVPVNQPNIAVTPARQPIPSTSGGFFIPVAGGYMAPNGGGFCSEAAGGMICNGRFIPVH